MLPQVFIDTSSPEFIGWDDISGIDEVKAEIEEIIDYLKNPALLRLRGVSRCVLCLAGCDVLQVSLSAFEVFQIQYG
jgi:hypothetical protein